MNKSYVIPVVMLMCLLGVRVSASAQDINAVVVSVPFEFVAGGATLPAGKYRVSRLSPGANQELAISDGNKESAFVLPVEFDGNSTNQLNLSFEHVGSKYFLSKIKTAEGVYTMPVSKEMITLGNANTPTPGSLSSSGSH